VLEIDRARIDVTRREKSRNRAADAPDFGPKDAPSDAKQEPCDNREQGTRNEQQTGCDMDGEKPQGSCRVAPDRRRDRYWIENPSPKPARDGPHDKQRQHEEPSPPAKTGGWGTEPSLPSTS
jgi:hypothetical protein